MRASPASWATGKTEVGRRLARALGWPFVDTDALVEEAAGRSVAAIFAEEGEAAFRARERTAVAEACASPAAVIAVGGGALLDPDNRRGAARGRAGGVPAGDRRGRSSGASGRRATARC